MDNDSQDEILPDKNLPPPKKSFWQLVNTPLFSKDKTVRKPTESLKLMAKGTFSFMGRVLLMLITCICFLTVIIFSACLIFWGIYVLRIDNAKEVPLSFLGYPWQSIFWVVIGIGVAVLFGVIGLLLARRAKQKSMTWVMQIYLTLVGLGSIFVLVVFVKFLRQSLDKYH